MAINAMRQPPPAARTTVMRALRDLGAPDSRLGGAPVNISEPLGLYRLGLDRLSDPASIDQAEFVGWRYLLEGGGQGAGMADVALAGSEPPRFASLARNAQADFLLQAAHLAERLAEDLPGDCEARILIVPSLYVSALWLTTEPPIFIPFLDVSHPVRSADDVRVRPDFLQEIAERARLARDRQSAQPTARTLAP